MLFTFTCCPSWMQNCRFPTTGTLFPLWDSELSQSCPFPREDGLRHPRMSRAPQSTSGTPWLPLFRSGWRNGPFTIQSGKRLALRNLFAKLITPKPSTRGTSKNRSGKFSVSRKTVCQGCTPRFKAYLLTRERGRRGSPNTRTRPISKATLISMSRTLELTSTEGLNCGSMSQARTDIAREISSQGGVEALRMNDELCCTSPQLAPSCLAPSCLPQMNASNECVRDTSDVGRRNAALLVPICQASSITTHAFPSGLPLRHESMASLLSLEPEKARCPSTSAPCFATSVLVRRRSSCLHRLTASSHTVYKLSGWMTVFPTPLSSFSLTHFRLSG